MNLKVIIKYICRVLLIEAALLVIPLGISLYDDSGDAYCFIYTIGLLLIASLPANFLKVEKDMFHAKEGFATVGLTWVFMSVFGAMPYMFGNVAGGGFADCFFEAVSGFTTTGATVIKDVEILSRAMLFWRVLTQWIGGMGVLVFTLALASKAGGPAGHIMRAESTGPAPSRLVPKLSESSKILYIIYTGMTIILIICAAISGLPLYSAISHSMSAAATGGFSILNASIAGYANPAAEWVLGVGMFCFGVNFTIFFYLLRRDFESIRLNEEFIFYGIVVLASTIFIALNLFAHDFYSITNAIRQAFFHVSSIITTTGLVAADINVWPEFSKAVLFMLMFFGGSSGSTAGGLKIIRVLLVTKLIFFEVSKVLHPKAVNSVKLNGKPVSDPIVRSVAAFYFAYMFIFVAAILIVSLDGMSLETNFSAVACTLNNVGAAFGHVSVAGNFADYSALSKHTMSLCMLIGRLEIFPIFVMLSPAFWKGLVQNYKKRPKAKEF